MVIIMSTREDAQDFLNRLLSCMPTSFYHDMELTNRGIGFVLCYLRWSEGEVIAGDFSKLLHVSTARIAALLKKMEQSGLITRRCSSKDARQTVVEITPAGIALADGLKEQALKEVGLLLDELGAEDLNTYIRISQKIREALNRQAAVLPLCSGATHAK